MRYRAPWDITQATLAKSLVNAGLSYEEAARRMGRTPLGIRKAIFRYFGPQGHDPVDRFIVGPPIGLTIECKRIKGDAISGSAALAEALNSLLTRMDAQTRARCLGIERQLLPGQEVIFKTASIERLAA